MSTAKRVVALGLLAALAVSCSITSTSPNVDHMRCVKAHDEWHDDGGVTTICDEYSPEPTP